ncbi:sugar ABC transporter ATP-binding protein [Pseudactinotalea sp. Z1739]|uniref:sugar ABC transporter ATP-binding protein n=1 Tax=Pseudactinotalea sp. Z1739 TaxID=3413028 RepID=UPI003C7B617B
MSDSTNVLLEVRNCTVRFPGVVAVDDVSFQVHAGECHALVGENGAGKSSLIKAIIGENRMATGEVSVQGEPIPAGASMQEIQDRGIAVVHQELQLVEDLSALENIFLGQLASTGPFVHRAALRRRGEELMKFLQIELDLNRPVRSLRTSDKQVVQLARALARDARVVIFDELTAVLPEQETKNVYRLVRLLKERGLAVVYISHRLDEIFELCDRYTVLTDGKQVGSGQVDELTKPELIQMIAGRELTKIYPTIAPHQDDVLLEVQGLSSPVFSDVNLTLRCGEVVGIAGLVGAGKTELLQSIYGAMKTDGGTIRVRGEQVRVKSPIDAIRVGMGLVPDERKTLGLNMHTDVRRNATIASLKKFKRGFFFMDERKERSAAYDTLERLGTRYRSLFQGVRKLSGGNQQKVIIGRWLLADTDIFLMDEPTRGIDVGSKSEIYNLIGELTARGKGVLMVSPELEELLGVCHRIYVMYEGRIVDEVSGSRLNQDQILESLMGAKV